MKKKTFLIAAGGTGGHIIPGILIGRELEKNHSDTIGVEFICGSREIEKKIYDSESIEPIKLHLGNSWEKIPLVKHLNLLVDFISVFSRFLFFRPAGVLAMGGKACFPVIFAARILRIPYFLHESNRIPGKVIRYFHKGARRVFLGMGGLEGDNVSIVGTPSRQKPVEDRADKNVFLCVGGSQGAARLNQLFIEAANSPKFQNSDIEFQLITGPGKIQPEAGRAVQKEYDPNIAAVLARSVAMISRAGSGSLADITTFRVPAILVPYPYAADDHQSANARYFSDRGAAVYTDEKTLNADVLANLMSAILQDQKHRENLRDNLENLARDNAAEEICQEIAGTLLDRSSHKVAVTQGESGA